MKYCLLLLLIPGFLQAQELRPVKPVLSDDYRELLRKSRTYRLDSTRFQSGKQLRSGHYNRLYFGNKPVDVEVSNGYVRLLQVPRYSLRFSGTFGNMMEVKTVNRTPALQREYAQGRAENGSLQWRGAETGEMFSYGPALPTLAFDGSAYPYDAHGKLIPAGSGNNQPARVYYDDIFQPAVTWKTGLSLNGAICKEHEEWIKLNLNLEHSDGGMVVRYNNSQTNKLITGASFRSQKFHIELGYQYRNNHATTDNRNGFLNRVWQQALLTPASFDNNYSSKAYGGQADNPLTLLRDNGNRYTEYNHGYTARISYERMRLSAATNYAGITSRQRATESYPAGTSGFPPEGIAVDRNTRQQQHVLNTNVTYKVGGRVYSNLTARHILTAVNNVIGYTTPGLNYQYQRTVNELLLEAPFNLDVYRTGTFRVEVSNRAYLSNTARQQEYWLPAVGASFSSNPNYYGFNGRIFTRWSNAAHELPLDRSLAYLQLMRYHSGDIRSYFPLTEITTYQQERAVRTREWNTGLEIRHRRLALDAAVYSKKVKNDLFPRYVGTIWQLDGLADHRTTGYELTLRLLRLYWIQKKLDYSGNITLNSYRNKVTDVYNGSNYTPIAGFSDVNTALVKGEPFGVIVGSTWRRDAAGNRIIGPDGFPLAAADKGIIGNPNPDFILKHSSQLFWRNWELNVALEWKKGGQKWNGTQAMLDYYGRSASSGKERNNTGYIFDGVTADGHTNTKPVTLYDPARSLSENRWVRYGPGGVAEDYVQQADYLRLNAVQLSHRWNFKKLIRELTIAGYVNNLLLWTPYEGGDPAQLLFDYPNSAGLDFFNLPSLKTIGCNLTIKF